MSVHVLLNSFSELRKGQNAKLAEHFIFFFRNQFNKFINTGACLLDSVYQMTLK